MITIKQARYLLYSLHICSKLFLLPLTIHPNKGKISIERRGARWKIWWFVIHAFSIRGLYSIFLLLKMCYHRSSFTIQTFTLHVVATIIFIDGIWIAHDLFGEQSVEIVMVFNSLLFHEGYSYKRRGLTMPTFQDLLVLFSTNHFPFSQINYASLVVLTPGTLEYPVPSSICGAACSGAIIFITELTTASFFLVLVVFACVTVILFFHCCEYWLRSRCRYFEARIQRGSKKTEIAQAYKDLREFQIYMQLFNCTFYRHLFLWKNGAVIVGVSTISCAILIVHQYPLQAFYMLLIALHTLITFPAVFNDGSRIPAHIQKLKQKLKGTCQNGKVTPHWTMKDRQFYMKSIGSIPNLGIKLGCFQQLERLATPLCIGLIVTCVIKVLFAFK